MTRVILAHGAKIAAIASDAGNSHVANQLDTENRRLANG
jgi:hypothetical protein